MMGEPPPPAPRSFLNARRLRYAWIAGVILWGGWLVSLTLGPATWTWRATSSVQITWNSTPQG